MSSQTQILPFTLLFCVSDTIYLEVSAAEGRPWHSGMVKWRMNSASSSHGAVRLSALSAARNRGKFFAVTPFHTGHIEFKSNTHLHTTYWKAVQRHRAMFSCRELVRPEKTSPGWHRALDATAILAWWRHVTSSYRH